MNVIVIETPELGDRSYIAYDKGVAIVIDPQRDVDRVEAYLDSLGVELAMVCETHLHNDYVTGGLELAQRYGAPYLVGGGHEALFSCHEPHDGETFEVGDMVVTAILSPGHTEGHVSYLIASEGSPPSIFTGGSMLFGTVGRTDLVSHEATDRLTRAQYGSVRRMAFELEADIRVQPTHGFGSFCSSASTSGVSESTIGQEKTSNIACVTPDEETFVKTLLSGLTAYPRYYSHMGPLNRSGAPSPFLLQAPPTVDAEELRRRLNRGEWVIDLRNRREFAEAHIKGTVGVEHNNSFTTYLGWVLPWGMPLTVLGESTEQVLRAQRDLSRIGIERFSGMAIASEALGWGLEMESYRAHSFIHLADRLREDSDIVVLDVRRIDEWESGHLEGAQHLPLQDLVERIDEITPDGEIWVHCAAGFRASIGASLVSRSERQVILIDDAWENASKTDLPVVR